MPGTFGTLEIGKSALFTQMRALSIVGHNIANADTPEYARQRADIVSRGSETLSAFADEPYIGQTGSGVMVRKVTQFRDKFLDVKVKQESSTREYWQTLQDNLHQVEYILGELSDSNLRQGMGEFFNAMSDLVENPTSLSTRVAAEEKGVLVAGYFNEAAQALDTLKSDINIAISDKVGVINELARRIAELNREIAITRAQNIEPNDLRDKREVAMQELAEIVNVDIEYDSMDKVVIRVGTRELVNRDYFTALKIVGNNDNRGLVDIRWSDERDDMSNNTDVVTIAARPNAEVRNYTITVNQLAEAQMVESQGAVFPGMNDSIASVIPGATSGSLTINGRRIYVDVNNDSLRSLTDRLNARSAGVTASWVPQGAGFGLQLEANQTGTANDMVIGSASDTSNLFQGLGLIGGYDGLGNGIINGAAITRDSQDSFFDLFDGVNTVSHTYGFNRIEDEAVLKDVVINLHAQGTTYLGINPVVRNSSIKALLDIRDYEIAKVEDGLDELAYSFANEFNAIHFEGFGQTGQSQNNFFTPWAGLSDNNDKFHGAARAFSVSAEVFGDPTAIAAAAGRIRAGSVIPEIEAEGNSENALAMFNLKDKKVLANGTAGFQEYFTSINARIGILAQNAEKTVKQKEFVIQNLNAKRLQTMGVNLDEEMVDLVKFQQSYAAASRFISVFDKMLESLINMV